MGPGEGIQRQKLIDLRANPGESQEQHGFPPHPQPRVSNFNKKIFFLFFNNQEKNKQFLSLIHRKLFLFSIICKKK